VSELRSAIEELRLEDLDRLGDRQLEDDFAELERLTRALESERLRRLAAIDRRQTWLADGYLSTSAWLSGRFRVGWTVATRQLRHATAIEQMPATSEALASGEISPCSAAVLIAAREAHPDAFARQEDALVDAARTLSVRELRRAVAYWRQALDGPRALEDAEIRHELRRLHLSPTLEGMTRVDGDLDPETGEIVVTALRAVMDSEERAGAGEDRRTAAQRRADALGEVCRQWLDRSSRPTIAGERPHVNATVDLGALRGQAGSTSELDFVGPIHPETARRIACDASISRVITSGTSEPLDIGRRTPTVPAPLRRAVALRDRHCRFPGCDRPQAWCDAHHVVHWSDGGATALSNLALLCRRHHRLVHEGGFGMELVRDRIVFTMPDGSALEEDRAPP
jgi:hypothetical protein